MRPTVLIVDDVAVNRHLLRKIVEGSGYRALEAESGEMCLSLCERELPAIILLDVQMPGLSGYDVCERLRRYYTKQELPIIMVTESSEPDHVAAAFAAGVNDHVAKPVNRAVLLARVSNQLAVSYAQREVEEQKQKIARALEIQRAMGDQLPEGIAVEDETGSIVYNNKQFAHFCGGTAPRGLTVSFEYLLGGSFHGELLEAWNLIQENNEEHLEREFIAYTHSRLVLHVISHRITTNNKEKLRLWVFRDLTTTRELEDAASHRVKFDTLGTFSAGVAHNFNNILSSILGASELLKRLSAENPKTDRYIKIIQQSVDGGKEFTRRLASMVRKNISSEGEQCVNIIPCVEMMIECYREATGSRITYSHAIESNLPTINLTERNFIDMLANIVANASDSIAKEGDVIISAGLDVSKRYVELVVKDSGIGMTPEEIARIFEPFYSTKNLDVQNGVSCQGHGLGLWAVYNLVKGAQGDIQVESIPGKGTTVKVKLPIVNNAVDEYQGEMVTH